MNRDAEHTPNGYEDAASVVVNQAPAPSSLAGGSLIADLKVLSDCDDMEVSHIHGDTNIGDVARRCLAALSPEAPAREEGELEVFPPETTDVQSRYIIVHQLRASADIQDDETKRETGWATTSDRARLMRKAADTIESLAALTPRHEAREGEAPNDNPLTFGMGALVVNTGKFGGDNAVFIARAKEPGEVGAYTGKSAFDRKTLQPGELVMIFPTAEQAQVVADALVGALTPRHEAPAEGAGEREAIARIVEPSAFVEETTDHSRVYRNLSLQEGRAEAFTKADVIISLRARSSAPEAREGNQPHCQLCGGTVEGWFCQTCEASFEEVDGLLVLKSEATHPAAPSADKLLEGRDNFIVSEGLWEKFVSTLSTPDALKGDAKP